MYASLRRKVVKGEGLKTVVIAAPLIKTQPSSNKPWVVLLDSGADDDIIFVTEEEAALLDTTPLAYSNIWSTSNGDFKTHEVADLDLVFPEYSQSKIMSCTADIKLVPCSMAV